MSDLNEDVIDDADQDQGFDEVDNPTPARRPVYSDALVTGNGVKVLDVGVVPAHHYWVGVDTGTTGEDFAVMSSISFQEGPTGDHGVNGVTNEALLAILIDRTEHLNEAFPSPFNDTALHHMRGALTAFEDRIKERLDRGVYGKNEE